MIHDPPSTNQPLYSPPPRSSLFALHLSLRCITLDQTPAAATIPVPKTQNTTLSVANDQTTVRRLLLRKIKKGAASAYSSGPCMRLLRGVKAAGGGNGARRLAALARRLSSERAALEATVAASTEETRAWRAAANQQASAVWALGQVRRKEGGRRRWRVGAGDSELFNII